MGVINSIFSFVIKKRMHQMELFIKYPHDVQHEWFEKLISTAKDTEWGKQHRYDSVHSVEEFKRRFPVQQYEDLQPYVVRLKQGEQNLLWPSEIKWFAKSSGTTAGKSKFIPVSREALEECHYKGGKDALSIHYHNVPDSGLFSGRTLVVGGSHQINQFSSDSYYGDLSAIILKNLPFWVEIRRTPNLSIALMEEWEQKIEQMARVTAEQDVTNISGVPSWVMVLLNRILEISGKENIRDVWPNLELFMHGGVNFSPYAEQYHQLIDQQGMFYMEMYNASEGFFGIQDRYEPGAGMLLMLDYGIFYEFMPMNELGKDDPKTLTLDEVEVGTNYALVISTNGGLWRYMIGDTVRFTSLDPYRIKVTGRTKHFINAFGEELIVENADQALQVACEKTGARINEYTVAPVYMETNAVGTHQWLIEFSANPESMEYFIDVLDNALKACNSDYEAKRYKDMAIAKPQVVPLEEGTFFEWMKSKGKLGGQNKVPRLNNDRAYADEILSFSARNLQESTA